METKLTRSIQNLLLFTIACTPLFSLREFLKFSGFSVPAYTLYLNLFKDLLIGIIFLLSSYHFLIVEKSFKRLNLCFYIFFAFTLLVAILSLYDPLMVVAGFRWCLPLLLLFSLTTIISRNFLQRLLTVVIFLSILTTAVQLYQVVTRQFRWSRSMYTELLGRVPGFYELPSTTGFVTCIAFFLIRYFYTGPLWIKRSLLAITMFSNFFLSISTTGFILMLIMLVFPLLYRPKKYRVVYVFGAVALSIVLYYYLDTLNGRYSGDSRFSWNVRVTLMIEQLHHLQLISNKFGGATNAVFILKGALGKPINVNYISGGGESLYPPLLGNYGAIFFGLCIVLLAWVAFYVLKYKNEARCLFFFVAILGALTTRVTEIFPLGVLIAVVAAYFLSNEQEEFENVALRKKPVEEKQVT